MESYKEYRQLWLNGESEVWFRDGILPETLDKIETELGFVLPPDLRAIHLLNDGMIGDAFYKRRFFRGYHFYDLATNLSQYENDVRKREFATDFERYPILAEIKPSPKKLIPFLSDDSHLICIHNDESQMVFALDDEAGIVPYFDNLNGFFRALLHGYREGVVIFHGVPDLDFDYPQIPDEGDARFDAILRSENPRTHRLS